MVYSGPDEQHEMGVSLSAGTTLPTSVLGAGVNAAVVNGVTVLSWRTTAADRALRLGPLYIYFIGKCVSKMPREIFNLSQIGHLRINIGFLMFLTTSLTTLHTPMLDHLMSFSKGDTLCALPGFQAPL